MLVNLPASPIFVEIVTWYLWKALPLEEFHLQLFTSWPWPCISVMLFYADMWLMMYNLIREILSFQDGRLPHMPWSSLQPSLVLLCSFGKVALSLEKSFTWYVIYEYLNICSFGKVTFSFIEEDTIQNLISQFDIQIVTIAKQWLVTLKTMVSDPQNNGWHNYKTMVGDTHLCQWWHSGNERSKT